MTQRTECEVHKRTKSRKEVATDPKTNMGSTSEKCPRTSQLMLDEGEPSQNQKAENEYLRKLLDFSDFQKTNSEGFSNGLTQNSV